MKVADTEHPAWPVIARAVRQAASLQALSHLTNSPGEKCLTFPSGLQHWQLGNGRDAGRRQKRSCVRGMTNQPKGRRVCLRFRTEAAELAKPDGPGAARNDNSLIPDDRLLIFNPKWLHLLAASRVPTGLGARPACRSILLPSDCGPHLHQRKRGYVDFYPGFPDFSQPLSTVAAHCSSGVSRRACAFFGACCRYGTGDNIVLTVSELITDINLSTRWRARFITSGWPRPLPYALNRWKSTPRAGNGLF